MLGSSAILLIVVVILAIQNYNRERFHGGGRGRTMGRGRHGGLHARENDWCLAAAQGENGNVILVGLDMKIFEDARAEDVRNAMLISGVLVLLGFAGFVSLFWMQNYHAARRSLSDTSAFAGELVANLPLGLVAADKHGKIVFFNGEAEKITGVEFSQARGKSPNEILPDRLSEITHILDRGERVSEREMECEFVQGKPVPVSVTASRIVNEHGQLVGGVVIIKDLAELPQPAGGSASQGKAGRPRGLGRRCRPQDPKPLEFHQRHGLFSTENLPHFFCDFNSNVEQWVAYWYFNNLWNVGECESEETFFPEA